MTLTAASLAVDENACLRQGDKITTKKILSAEADVDSVVAYGAVGKGRDQKWWGREERAEVLATVRKLRASGVSERAAADRVGVPRSTLQDWTAWGEHVDAHADVTAFFESPLGLAVLHRVVVAAHVVFVELGACGIRTVCKFLQLTGLDRFVASSFESQRRVNVAVERATVDYAEAEHQRLAATMPDRKITVAQDETFTGGLCLVAIEPESDYILLERRAKARDAATWDTMMKEAMAGLKVEVIQSTSDEGKGVVAYAEKLLGVHHSPDLFHVQQELSRAVAPAAAAKLRAAERAADEAEKNLAQTRLEAKRYLDELAARGPGRPPDWGQRVRDAEAMLGATRAEVTKLTEVREELRGAVRAIGPLIISSTSRLAHASAEASSGRSSKEPSTRSAPMPSRKSSESRHSHGSTRLSACYPRWRRRSPSCRRRSGAPSTI